jgi:hypothetical protein
VHSDPPNGHGRVRIGSRPGENARFLVTEEDVRAIHDALHALSNGRSRGEGAGS